MFTRPSFVFYPDRFLGGTTLMSSAAVGAYMRMLCVSWNHGAIPNTKGALARAMSLTPLDPPYDDIWAEISPKWTLTQSGWVNGPLEAIRQEAEAFSLAQSAKGKKRHVLAGSQPEASRESAEHPAEHPAGSQPDTQPGVSLLSRSLSLDLSSASSSREDLARPAPKDGCFYTKAENDAWAAATGQKLGHDRPAPVQSRGVSDPGRHQTKCHGFGTLPSCARGLCIPAFLGQEWVDQVGSAGVEYVAQFVADVVHGTPDGPVGDPLKFWRSAWDAKHRAAKDRPALMRAGSMDWADECAARHGGACPSQYQHGLKMQREQGRTA